MRSTTPQPWSTSISRLKNWVNKSLDITMYSRPSLCSLVTHSAFIRFSFSLQDLISLWIVITWLEQQCLWPLMMMKLHSPLNPCKAALTPLGSISKRSCSVISYLKNAPSWRRLRKRFGDSRRGGARSIRTLKMPFWSRIKNRFRSYLSTHSWSKAWKRSNTTTRRNRYWMILSKRYSPATLYFLPMPTSSS